MIEMNIQQTIASPMTLKGVGLHTGRKCVAQFFPAPEDHGIKFVRTDLPGKPSFLAHVNSVVDVVRGTTLGMGEGRVYTIEHVLSALNGLEIDNLLIEMNENEPPILDGSAIGFIEAIEKAGIQKQNKQRDFFRVDQPVVYESNQTLIKIEPADHFELHCEVSYDHPLIRNQKQSFVRGDDYSKEIAPARTFCFDYEIESLKKNGLAKGGSLDNAIVIGPEGIYNPDAKLRFENEFVRHKILDLMGDLMLLGKPLKGKITALRCGHGHNVKFLKQLINSQKTTASA
ncbi:MAG: UDP-3-O-acyl-N-acetylglucosamine deacetylase [Elusimicrobiota bacterium]